MMGACMSSNKEDEEQKKRSQAIDRALDEDSKKLRRECKILLLGAFSLPIGDNPRCWLIGSSRLGRKRQIHNRKADEDYTLEGLF